jgi:hypothetical protein
MARKGTLGRLIFGLIAGTVVAGVAMAEPPEMAQPNTQQVVVLDECDPGTFNAAFGPDTCHNVVSGGGVKLQDFLTALPTGHPAWLFFPSDRLEINESDTVRIVSQGGEIHTFTEVAAYGGGFIPVLNNPPNSPAVPECDGGYAKNAKMASTRLIQGSSLLVGGLTKGVHHFECCVHPWMRLDVEVK